MYEIMKTDLRPSLLGSQELCYCRRAITSQPTHSHQPWGTHQQCRDQYLVMSQYITASYE